MSELTQLEKLRAACGRPLLRPLASSPEIRPGTDDSIIRMQDCPDCDGYGWLVENPLANYGRTFRQCPTCLAAKRHYDQHGALPADITAAVAAVAAQKALVQRGAALVRAGKRAQAVRFYRKATGCSLREAHQALGLR